MEKKTPRIVRACPWENCRNTVSSGAIFNGEGEEIRICPACKRKILMKVMQKTIITFTKIVCVITFLALAVRISNETTLARKVTCDSFSTHAEAQKLFDSDPIKYKNLDKNDNKVACEFLK